MKSFFTILFTISVLFVNAQSSIKGALKDDKGEAVPFANVALYSAADSSLVKVETSKDNGNFQLNNLKAGNYFLKATFVGLPTLTVPTFQLNENEKKDLANLTFKAQAEELAAFTVVEERVMVEVKPDRTVFNVEGTINSTGSDAISLLRKAPAVTVDQNDNVNVLGRSGVLVYVDGKQLPLSGEDLSNFLKNLPADQIDRIEIITNPGAKYDANGNAGIIDIRLKKDKSVGANGTLSGTFTQGELTRYNVNASGNYRNKKMNVFGTIGFNDNKNFHNILSESYQNGVYKDEINNNQNNRKVGNYRLGTDFFLHKNHTIGFLVGGRNVDGKQEVYNEIKIANQNTETTIDSILLAESTADNTRKQNTYNINYRFYNKKGQSLNLDLDYGTYRNTNQRNQPNIYYTPNQDSILAQTLSTFNTPRNIDIYTGKLDYERNIGKGKIGLGTKYSRVETNNTFEVSDEVNNVSTINNTLSNLFDYDENVYAGYASFSHPLGKKFNAQAGLRAEQTEAVGTLTAYDPNLQAAPVELNYLSWFPNAGLTYKVSKMNSLALNYGRRINRPDYNVLNPFRTQRSELSIERGNPFLKPEIVNNFELGYTLFYKYNFKIAYSRTDDKITRLIGPDGVDPRASFISWDNLATEEVISFNASLPVTIKKKFWNAFFNLSANHINNQADYGNGAVVDVQNFGYTIYQQHTFSLPKGFKAEISGYYSGPGVWGGVFKYDANWSVGAGLSKEFFKKKLKARLNASNIFRQVGWKGSSEF
ncbi:MAG: TonB-dependent receptor domain-containing protein, partial [Vicingaceae bacterium]